MFSLKTFRKTFMIFLFIFFFVLRTEARPHRRRSVSEVQLMHNLGELRHLHERQDWLQAKLKRLHTAGDELGDAQRVLRVRAGSRHSEHEARNIIKLTESRLNSEEN